VTAPLDLQHSPAAHPISQSNHPVPSNSTMVTTYQRTLPFWRNLRQPWFLNAKKEETRVSKILLTIYQTTRWQILQDNLKLSFIFHPHLCFVVPASGAGGGCGQP
jgi:hypothetical protein